MGGAIVYVGSEPYYVLDPLALKKSENVGNLG